MMTEWYQKAIDALQLNGLGERTQEAYVRALRMLCEFYHKTPDLISESELQKYFLHRKNHDRWSSNTMRICYCGIRFFFLHVLKRDWHTLDLVRAQSERRLPAVLSLEEVRAILGCVRTPHNRAFLSTVYACGLRLQEAQHLEISDIDSQRKMIHVHRGKGAKDRFVPLPESTLQCLRRHWVTHRHPRLLFPALGRGRTQAAQADTPMPKASAASSARLAGPSLGLAFKAPSVRPRGRPASRNAMSRSIHSGILMPPICSRPASTSA